MYQSVIGLEIHAHLLTASKMFCGCSAAFGGAPNTHVCPVCLGLPGALPLLNRGAVDSAVRADGSFYRERSGSGARAGVCPFGRSRPATHSTSWRAVWIASRAVSADTCEPGPVR